MHLVRKRPRRGRASLWPSITAWVALLATVSFGACSHLEAPPTREVVHLSGGPYARGVQHGQRLGSKIRSFYTTILTASLIPYVNRERADIAKFLIEYTDPKYDNGEFARQLLLQSAREMEKSIAPEHIEELKGVAAGAGIDYEEILILNTFLDTVLVVRAIAYVLRLGQAPRLRRIEFIGAAAETSMGSDGFDNDGDGTIDDKKEGLIAKYDPSPHALMADVPLDAEIRFRLTDPDGVDPQTVRIQLDNTMYEPGSPSLSFRTFGEASTGVAPPFGSASSLPAAATRVEVRFKPAANLPAAAVVALIIQAGDSSTVTVPPPPHARFMRDERLLFSTAGYGEAPQKIANRSVDDGRSQPPASAFALRDTALAGGGPLLGQHFSLLDANSSHKHTVALVHHPDDGEAFVTVGWAGLIYGLSGMNLSGLAAAAVYSDSLDNRLVGTLLSQVLAGGGLSAGRLIANGLPVGFALRQILEQSDNVASAATELSGMGHAVGWNFLLADAKGGLQAVEVDSGAVSFPPKADPVAQTFTYGPDDADPAARALASVGKDDLRVAAHFQANTNDVMSLPVSETIRIDPQRIWSSYYFKSLRVFAQTADQLSAGYGTFDLAAVQRLLGDPALVDTSDSMNAVVYEPAKFQVHAAMGAVPATSVPFETIVLTQEAP